MRKAHSYHVLSRRLATRATFALALVPATGWLLLSCSTSRTPAEGESPSPKPPLHSVPGADARSGAPAKRAAGTMTRLVGLATRPPAGTLAGAGTGARGASSRGTPPHAGAGFRTAVPKPPMHFDGRIPPDLPPFPGGVDGTEFFPDPFFYGEETWDGLEVRLQLYLAYQHKDLAAVAVARNLPESALEEYERLERTLEARPVTETILRDIHDTLVDWARRARTVLLIRLGRFGEASACIGTIHWASNPADTAWRDFLEAALAARANRDMDSSARYLRVAETLRQLLPGPPWTPRATGPAPAMAARHADRLDRLRAYVLWFDPLATVQPWGVYSPLLTQRALWVRALAATLAASGDPGARRSATEALLEHLLDAPKIEVDRSRLTPAIEAARQTAPLDALVAAEAAVKTAERTRPRTSVERLQGMPTGDSYLDVLGQAGSPPVGRTEKLSLDDTAHRAWTERHVEAINAAIEQGRPGDVGPLLDEMIAELEAYPFDSRYFNIKRVRNEGIRLLVLTGQPDRALAMLDGFYPLQDLDYRVPCRKGVLEAMRGRIQLEAGRLDAAHGALTRALTHTRRWLGYVDRYRGTVLPPPAIDEPSP